MGLYGISFEWALLQILYVEDLKKRKKPYWCAFQWPVYGQLKVGVEIMCAAHL